MADRQDPFVSFHFSVDVQGAGVQGYFTEVSGVGSEHELIEDKVVDGDGREITRMIPGRLKFEPVVLKKGITSDMSFWDWRKTVVDGDLDGARAPFQVQRARILRAQQIHVDRPADR